MLFWDFGKEPEQSSNRVEIKCRLEQYEVHVDIDPNRIGRYDTSSKGYILYTRSTRSININDKVRELARIAVGDERNPYIQARRIYRFVRNRMRYRGEVAGFRRIRGSSLQALLESAARDQKTGEEYYEGQCYDYSLFFVALCRAVEVPARVVQVIRQQELDYSNWIRTELSPDGLAADDFYRSFGHVWAEFYLPSYGWIPVDPQKGTFGRSQNDIVIKSKGTDIRIGPSAPEEENQGYGIGWVGLHDGRADCIWPDVRNIAKIHKAEFKMFYHPDPFPADAFAGYPAGERRAAQYRKETLTFIDDITREQPDKNTVLANAYEENSQLWSQLEPFVCHMLRKLVGDKKFFDIYETYTELRVKSGEPVSTACFQKIAENIYDQPLDWFFQQWTKNTDLPQLRLDAVRLSKEDNSWYVRGNLHQLNSSLFRLPVELVLEAEGPTERKQIWMESKNTRFEFRTAVRPRRVLVDPNNDILQIRKMPPLLVDFWNAYPKLVIVYGTIAEGEENKAAAESLNKEYLGLDPNIVKADIEVNDADLKGKCLIFFGRPDTNRIVRRFENLFPIKFDGDKFTWLDKTYDKPSLGVAQIVESPHDSAVLIVHCAGLNTEAMQKLKGNYLSFATSYVIFDGDRTVLLGDWQNDNELIWEFEENKTTHKP
ncbi:MAG: transglutaminase-like domain-containing protein [Planctomycetota bacterium]